jgi:hypothetical protein
VLSVGAEKTFNGGKEKIATSERRFQKTATVESSIWSVANEVQYQLNYFSAREDGPTFFNAAA